MSWWKMRPKKCIEVIQRKQGEEWQKRILASPKCLGRQIAYLTELACVSQHRNFGCLFWPGFLPVISSFTHRGQKKSWVLTYLLNEAHNSVFHCTPFRIRHIIYSQISQLNAALSLWKGLQNFIWIQASSCVLCPVWLLKSQCVPFYVWSRLIPVCTERLSLPLAGKNIIWSIS